MAGWELDGGMGNLRKEIDLKEKEGEQKRKDAEKCM
jgi:hypothetical protein